MTSGPRTLSLVALLCAQACESAQCDCAEVDAARDSSLADTLDIELGLDSEAVGDDCFLLPHLGKTWGSSLGEVSERLWFALLSDGYLVGQFVGGPRSTTSCFELAWEMDRCTPNDADVLAYSFCAAEAIDIQIHVERSDQVIDGFSTVEVNGQLYEVLFDANPSSIDAQCRSFECDTTWDGIIH